jgi:ABC-type uncharacterized transport system auxiliary subunit
VKKRQASFVALAALAAMAGCGPSEPVRQIKPLTERPPVQNDFTKLKTPEEKIKFIENSGAPEAEKQRATAQVRAGNL